MRVAALYDIHGNLPALEAVLADARRAQADRIVIGGDVLPGPMPRESLELLLGLDLPVQFIHGNGDRVVLEYLHGQEPLAVPEPFRDDIRWNARQLAAHHERALAAWPATCRVSIPELGEVLFCHATPRNDTEIFTRLTSDDRLQPIFEGPGASVVVCGHTHMQFDRMVGTTRVVNAGSVGMPYGKPGAYWLMLGPAVELRFTSYDLAAAAERVRRTNYPHAEEFAARDIMSPRPEQDMLQLLSKAELR